MTSDWRTKFVDVKQRGAELLKTGYRADCVFLIGEDKVQISAHKSILAMASPVFDMMLYGPFAQTDKAVSIKDLTEEDFNVILGYIYTDNISLKSCDMARGVFYGAHKYMLPHLEAACITYLSENLTPENVCRNYEFAQLFQIKNLIEKSIQVIKCKTKEVLDTEGLTKVSLETLEMIFSLDTLKIESEFELVRAAERYAQAQPNCKPSNTHCSKLDVSDDIPTIYNAIRKIRFLTMNQQQFVQHRTLSSFLSESEMLAVLMNMISENASKPMPSGLSTSRVSRKKKDGDETSLETTMLFVINVSDLSKYSSPPFYVGGAAFRVITHDVKNAPSLGVALEILGHGKSDNDFLSLAHMSNSTLAQWACQVIGEFSFRTYTRTIIDKWSYWFAPSVRQSPFTYYDLPNEKIVSPDKKVGSITLEVHVVVETPPSLN